MTIPSLAPSVLILSVINALLRREPWASQALSVYSGKTILFRFAEKNVVQATVNSAGGLDNCDPAIVADVVLSVPFTDLADLVKTFREQGADGVAKQMHIQGDAGLAQILADLSRNLRWDAEADLANLVGDIAAVRIGGFVRSAFSGFQNSTRRFNGNLREYLLQESGFAVQRGELQVLQNGLAEISRRVDDLDARIVKIARA